MGKMAIGQQIILRSISNTITSKLRQLGIAMVLLVQAPQEHLEMEGEKLVS